MARTKNEVEKAIKSTRRINKKLISILIWCFFCLAVLSQFIGYKDLINFVTLRLQLPTWNRRSRNL